MSLESQIGHVLPEELDEELEEELDEEEEVKSTHEPGIAVPDAKHLAY